MSTGKGEPLLVARGLVKRFGGLAAVDNVDLTVYEGEVVGLIGPNGAGKSTLFNLLSGALPPTAGTIMALGQNITGQPAYQVCRIGIGRTFQIVRPLAGLTVLDNVMVGALARTNSVSEARRRSREIVVRVGLGDYAEMPARTLNLSNHKRLEVARALATQPRILLLDEVMAGLNHAELDRFIEFVQSLNRDGITLVVVEHLMHAVVNLCSRIMVMNFGRKIAEGAPDAVLSDPQVIEAYLGGGEAAS